MTCIVAIRENGKIYMGADSCSTYGGMYDTDVDTKIFKQGDFLIGGAGCVRVSDLVRYGIQIPENLEIDDLERFIRVDFVNGLRAVLGNSGALGNNAGREYNNGMFLVAYKDKCFEVYSNFAVTSLIRRNYTSIGSGMQFALGSLKSTEEFKMTPEERIITALASAEQFDNGVKAPFKLFTTK